MNIIGLIIVVSVLGVIKYLEPPKLTNSDMLNELMKVSSILKDTSPNFQP